MQSHYEINVSLNGYHFFATHERSGISENHVEKVFKELKQRFPESQGFKIDCTYISVQGKRVNFE